MQNPLDSSLRTSTLLKNDKLDLDCHESSLFTKSLDSRNDNIITPKFYFILGIIFNLSLLGFFKYTDFLLENFNAFSQIAHLDFDIPLPHILLPLALSFVTFQQIAFLFDCYKHAKGELNENLNLDFIDYALFISFFPQLIAGPIVHHREMMPQFASMGNSFSGNHSADLANHHKARTQSPLSLCRFAKNYESTTAIPSVVDSANAESTNKSSLREIDSRDSIESISWQSKDSPSLACGNSTASPSLAEGARGWVKSTINYEYLAKGIFIFSIGLFKKVFIADSFAKWANAGFSKVENGAILNVAESWATSLSYTFQLYFDFSGYCDMAMGLGLMFGIILPLNFNSPYKSLNIAEFWRRWHITLGRFLRECLYIPLGGNRVGKILNLRNLFIVAFLSGIWHGAGWGFVIWGILHGVAMVVHRIYSWWIESLQTNAIMYRHCERGESERGNLTRIANDFIITQLANPRDCHDFATSAKSRNDKNNSDLRGSIVSETQRVASEAKQKSGLCSHERGNRTLKFIDEASGKLPDLSLKDNALYKFLCWFITFNFINIAWIFFHSENLSGAVNLLKGMFGIHATEIPHKWSKIFDSIHAQTNEMIIWLVCAFVVCLCVKNSFEWLKDFDSKILKISISARIFGKKIWLSGGAVFMRFVLTLALFYASVWILAKNVLNANAYTPFLYFNF